MIQNGLSPSLCPPLSLPTSFRGGALGWLHSRRIGVKNGAMFVVLFCQGCWRWFEDEPKQGVWFFPRKANFPSNTRPWPTLALFLSPLSRATKLIRPRSEAGQSWFWSKKIKSETKNQEVTKLWWSCANPFGKVEPDCCRKCSDCSKVWSLEQGWERRQRIENKVEELEKERWKE